MVSSDNDPPAPDGLDLVLDFVNTLDLDQGRDELQTPRALSAWLAARGLMSPARRQRATSSIGGRCSCARLYGA